MEDFKYEFDHYAFWSHNNYKYTVFLMVGYTFLHQFVKQDIEQFYFNNKFITEVFEDSLEDGETIEVEDNVFILTLKEINEDIVDYVKFLLKYLLVLYEDFDVTNNTIKWRRTDGD